MKRTVLITTLDYYDPDIFNRLITTALELTDLIRGRFNVHVLATTPGQSKTFNIASGTRIECLAPRLVFATILENGELIGLYTSATKSFPIR